MCVCHEEKPEVQLLLLCDIQLKALPLSVDTAYYSLPGLQLNT